MQLGKLQAVQIIWCTLTQDVGKEMERLCLSVACQVKQQLQLPPSLQTVSTQSHTSILALQITTIKENQTQKSSPPGPRFHSFAKSQFCL